ncbi:methyltransferase-like protein 7A [Nephila pilipes]|uniref:Methyltransferase-like protein 7A n=1 Tax=Nephila pilipes TaxID=299642 RepID=A0A8X6UD12_NEPPI|nr:methyltransferase-like protein 7A [Nephila pilipes]GFT71935.1 methyltransferase-like protein 7A [Nephila pilipes]GFT79174.1 methyltransferase-like protein 7A [Nephila pilipes]GFU06143.1 methyltransferase-like protein 7A [Nephila pilipes]
MEFFVYGIITVIWWLSSLTVLLPFVLLLSYSQSLKKIWFPFFFTFCIFPTLKRQLAPLRRCAFDLLQEHLGQRRKKGAHEILEIGIADGDNLPYYPNNSSLIALDPSEDFEELLKNNLKKHPQIMFKRKVTAMGENMVGVEDASVDVVVSTYVLCSVKDVRSVLKEVKRVLKPVSINFFELSIQFC